MSVMLNWDFWQEQIVSGTLFGNGERTGNVDIITLAVNMFSYGIDPKLDFADMRIRETYERLTRMHAHERSPSGDLFAFSGLLRMTLQRMAGEEKKLKTWTFRISRSIRWSGKNLRCRCYPY